MLRRKLIIHLIQRGVSFSRNFW